MKQKQKRVIHHKKTMRVDRASKIPADERPEVAVDVDKSFAVVWDCPGVGIAIKILYHIAYYGFSGQVDG